MVLKKLKIYTWIIFLIAATFIFKMQVTYAKCGQNINDDIQKIINEVRVKYQIPGIEVSISCPGENSTRDFISGTTTVNGSTLVKSNHLFQIGSETKSFIATIILQLESEGTLSIDDPISKWFPQIPTAWKNIKIRQLLNHTSGIFNISETDEFWKIEKKSNFKKQWTPDELIDLVVNKKPYFKPGMGHHYSNTNYILAGMLIHAITGKSVEEEMKIRLFEPLNLSNTYYLSRAYSKDILKRMAHGYSDRFSNKALDVTNDNMSMADASGAIISTSHDSAIWLRKLLTSYSVLPQKQRNELMSLVDNKSGKPLLINSKKSGYGLGIARHIDSTGDEIWFHGGGTLGYLSNMFWVKCNDIVVTTVINHGSKQAETGNNILRDNLITYLQQSDTSKQCKKLFQSRV